MMQMKIKKWGNSQGIRIPKILLSQIGIDNPIDQTINVSVNGDSIVITKAEPKKSRKSRFGNVHMSGFNVDVPKGELNWGRGVGAEQLSN